MQVLKALQVHSARFLHLGMLFTYIILYSRIIHSSQTFYELSSLHFVFVIAYKYFLTSSQYQKLTKKSCENVVEEK